jgi:adenylate cyclase
MVESSSSLTTKESFWQRWFAIPENAQFVERRVYINSRIATPAAGLLHLFYIFLFAYWGIWPLAIVNVFSVAIWATIFLLLRQRHISLAIILALFESLVHTTLVVIFLGWGFGVQYFLILTSVALVLVTWWPYWVNVAVVALCALLFVILYYYSESFAPLATAPPVQLAIINITNIAFTFGVMLAYISYLISATGNAEAKLEKEYQRSESLLQNVLPASIADRLKDNKGAIPDPSQTQSGGIAESFSDVSVLFADVVGFTSLSEQLAPQDMVDLLNEVFIAFDQLAEKYGVEKIRTIGDGYMVAAGAPLPLDDHAQALAAMALEMQAYMKRREQRRPSPSR